MSTKYHIRKAAKLDAAEKQREQAPGWSRKVLSRSAIKKAIRKKFRFGKNHVDILQMDPRQTHQDGVNFFHPKCAPGHTSSWF
jgi:hypothetical protein